MTRDDLQRRAGEVWGWLRALPVVVQLGIAVVLIVGVLAATGKLESVYSHARDFIFNKRAADAEAERDQKQLEVDAAIKRAEGAEARAAVLEDAAAAQKQIAEDKKLAAGEQARRAQEVENATEVAVERAGADPATARAEYRDRLRRLGYLPK